MGFLIGLIIWALFVVAGYYIGKRKGRVGAGVILALVGGLLGVVIIACLPPADNTEVQVQREYDIQQAKVSGHLPPPADS